MKKAFVQMAIAALFSISNGVWTVPAAGEEPIPCDVHQGSCKGMLSGFEVLLEISPRPVYAMTDLSFRLVLPSKSTEMVGSPFIDLGMPGMDMGRNRVELQPVSPGVYEGKGIIVRCPSGKRTWKAAVTVPGKGMITFIFDVHY